MAEEGQLYYTYICVIVCFYQTTVSNSICYFYKCIINFCCALFALRAVSLYVSWYRAQYGIPGVDLFLFYVSRSRITPVSHPNA
jgi:hypothetical protein